MGHLFFFSALRVPALLLLAVPCFAAADGSFDGATDEVRVGRYTVIGLGPSPQQEHPLQSLTAKLAFQPGATVGEAMRAVLLPTGYSLAPSGPAGSAMTRLLLMPLPAVQRSLPRMPADVALRMLAGAGFQIVVDPVNRLVAFDPAARFQSLD